MHRQQSSLDVDVEGGQGFEAVDDLQAGVYKCWAGGAESMWKLRGAASTINKLVADVNPNGCDGLFREMTSWSLLLLFVLNVYTITENWVLRMLEAGGTGATRTLRCEPLISRKAGRIFLHSLLALSRRERARRRP